MALAADVTTRSRDRCATHLLNRPHLYTHLTNHCCHAYGYHLYMPHSLSLSFLRSILPLAVLGMESTKMTSASCMHAQS